VPPFIRTGTRSFHLDPQPTETSCGPTCLHGIYQYHGRKYDLGQVLAEIPVNEDGGTYSVHLAIHAISQGFEAITYSYNLRVFDPTWHSLNMAEICLKLKQRIRAIRTKRMRLNHQSYIRYLEMGGLLRFDELTDDLLLEMTQLGPVLVGLSATHLYRHARQSDDRDDDIHGVPEGHFVVLMDYEPSTHQAVIADPYAKNPFHPDRIYRVNVHRFINAVLLGIVTYDANLLLLRPI